MELQGIETNFVTDWKKWDEFGCGVYYFYDVHLQETVFPFPIQQDVVYDVLVDTEKCIVEVYVPLQQDAPIFTSKFKAVLI